ncbi:LPS export ABC transporter periplasmic protein LptC [Marinicellulosiphila megalodicopiae]|uniref:LPS export ABC transporter periplasmic protein LptC n=1 Tax=Marinicellulosiphila megalodicopiae TaxID=2724896 RepID=UPI003BB039D7
MITKSQFSKLFIYGIIICISYTLIVFNFKQSNINDTDLIPKNSASDIKLSAINIYQTQYDEIGVKKIDIKAEVFTQYNSNKQEFSNPQFYFFSKQHNQKSQSSVLNWVITSDQAQINQPNIIEVIGNVEGNRTIGSEISFNTDWLNYDVINNTASSDADIIIWQQDNTTEATGFDVSLISNKIDIQLHNNVRFNVLEGDNSL